MLYMHACQHCLDRSKGYHIKGVTKPTTYYTGMGLNNSRKTGENYSTICTALCTYITLFVLSIRKLALHETKGTNILPPLEPYELIYIPNTGYSYCLFQPLPKSFTGTHQNLQNLEITTCRQSSFAFVIHNSVRYTEHRENIH